jgi:hypothetical protein
MRNYNRESHFTSGGNDLDLVSTLVGHLSKQALWDWFSPQFHIKLDTAFDTIPQVYEGKMKHTSLWQLKAGFLTSEKTSRATKLKERAKKAKQTETDSAKNTASSRHIFLARGRYITNPESYRDSSRRFSIWKSDS